VLYILIKGINMKSFLLGILLFISTANASDFLREFNGRTVTCEVASYNEELVPSFFRTSFVLMDILVSFDDQEQTEVFQGGKRIENLYSIKYQLRSKQGTMQFFFNMDYSKADIYQDGRKNVLDYQDDFKSYRLEFSNGLIQDKYKFIKNGKVQFVCRSFFDYQ